MNTKFDRRMKRYEQSAQFYLVRRMPVIIRIDGKAFHTLTRGFKKPFDDVLMHCMDVTMKSLVKQIQGCVFGYTQSDEISLLLIDYKTLESEAWFDYRIDKLCSIVASMATLYFNKELAKEIITTQYSGVYEDAFDKGALFDARAYNVPREDVNNYFIWRQSDCKRNALQSIAQYYFSDRELQGKKAADMIKMLQGHVDWEKVDKRKRFGWGYPQDIVFMDNDRIEKLVYCD